MLYVYSSNRNYKETIKLKVHAHCQICHIHVTCKKPWNVQTLCMYESSNYCKYL